VASEILDEFTKEKYQQTIQSLAQFATFNWEFRRIMSRLVAEGPSNAEELKKAYTKSINPDLHQKIQIYLKSEKAPVHKGSHIRLSRSEEQTKHSQRIGSTF